MSSMENQEEEMDSMKKSKEKKTKGFLQNLFNPLKEKVEEKRQENKELKELEKKAYMSAEEEFKKQQLEDKHEAAIQKGIEKAKKKYTKSESNDKISSDEGSFKGNLSRAVDDMFSEPTKKHDMFTEENISVNENDVFSQDGKSSNKRNSMWDEEFGN